MLPVWYRLDLAYREAKESELRSVVQERASSRAAAIAAAVNRRLTLTDSLYAFVQSELPSPRFEAEIRSFSAGLYAAVPGLRAVEVIPGGVIRFVYPLQGNEPALGHDLNNDERPEVRNDLQRSRRTGKHILTGPLELRQGGLGLIGRRVVFRDGVFWGYVTVVLDVKAVLNEAAAGPQSVRVALRDGRGRVFDGDPALFESKPVLATVPLSDGSWQLAAEPVDGWGSGSSAASRVYRGLLLSLAVALCGVVYLISERQIRLSRAVSAGEEQYRLVTETVPLLIASFDRYWRYRFANRAHDLWLGVAGDALNGKFANEVLGSDVAGKIAERSLELAAGKPVSFDAELSGSGGASRQVSVTCVRRNDREDPSADGFYLVAADITARKEAEAAIRLSESRLARAQAIARIGSWDLDLASMEAQCSAEACRIFDLPAETRSVPFQQVLAKLSAEDRTRVEELLSAAAQTGSGLDVEHCLKHGDGAELCLRMVAQVEFEDGRPVRLTGTVQDLTDYRQLEAQLRQSQKMEAIGQLAGGVAHDFNNLLSVILGYCEILLGDLSAGARLREPVNEIRCAGERAAALTRQLLAFSRRQILQPKLTNLNDVVRELQKMLGRLLGEDIHLETKLDERLGLVLVDTGQIQQVIINLAVNARDAMPTGGSLLIETRQVGGHPDHVVLRITDTGSGIPLEIQPFVFDPFFTTKQTGKGTGLGLAIVHGIVKQSGGEITLASEPGRGSTFTVCFPVAEAPADAPVVKESPQPGAGTETILLVEDDDSVRSLTRLMLTQLGYRVYCASHPADAISLVSSDPTPIHLLVTDVIMPGMHGPELAKRVRSLRPAVRLLFISGYVGNEAVDRAALDGAAYLLQKPFTRETLGRAIRRALDDSVRSS